jgi:hypothetical protein
LYSSGTAAATPKPGISALQLQGQLGLTRFETAWFLLYELRRAMVNPDRTKLSGTVEVDETWIGGTQAGLKGGRQRKGRKAIEVVVAVRAKSLGRLRLEIIRDGRSETRYDFIKRNVEPGSLIVSDACQGYSGIEPEIYDHESISQAAQKRAGGSPSAVPGVDRLTSNFKTWLRGLPGTRPLGRSRQARCPSSAEHRLDRAVPDQVARPPFTPCGLLK